MNITVNLAMGGSIPPQTDGLGRKLRLGLLTHSIQLPNWAHSMLRRIADSDYASIEVVLLSQTGNPPLPNTCSLSPAIPVGEHFSLPKTMPGVVESLEQHPGLKRWTRLIRRTTFRARQLAERRQKPRSEDLWAALMKETAPEPDAFEIIDATDLLRGIPVLDIARVFDHLEIDDITAIKAYDLDIIIPLGFRSLPRDLLDQARFGAWSYCHGDNDANHGGLDGVWEVLEGNPCTISVLQMIVNEDLENNVVLDRSWSATVPFSVVANRNQLYWKNALLLPRKLAELHRFGEQPFFERISEENRYLDFNLERRCNAPTETELNLLLPRLRQRSEEFARREKSFWEQWILLYHLKEAGSARSAPSTSLRSYKRMVPPQDRYWADPFPVFQDGQYWIFIEEYLLETEKGHIAVFAMDLKGNYETPTRVLERPYHLSYPFIFPYRDSWYMIPETKQNRSLELYECISFPNQWKLRRVLLDGVEAVDPTLFEYRGKWWIFTNIAENKRATSTWDELFVFHSDDLIDGVWKPHARNPIVSDVRKARPAGRLFSHNGTIYRPGQDCSRCYGYGIRLHEVLVLTEEEYREKEVCAIEPLWAADLFGVHTLNFEKELSVADALTRRPRTTRSSGP